MKNKKVNAPNKNSFSSIGAFLAVVSSALGLGNIWKFPGLAGNSGGAIFLLIYILLSFLASVPILLIEFYFGYKTKKSCFDAIKEMSKNNKSWQIITFIAILTSIFICAFYSDVIGWLLKYLYYSITNSFKFNTIEEAGALFNKTISSPISVLICQIIVLVLASIISFFGATKGVEKFVKTSIPTLLGILVIMGCVSFTLPGRNKAFSFLLTPNFSKLTSSVLISGLGLAFFKVTAGTMVMANYFSYFPENERPINSIFKILFVDLFVSIFCGLVLFPVIFTYQNEVSGGPGLLFVTSVVLLKKIFLGNILLVLFFLLAFLAALGALLSMMQYINRFFEKIFNLSEKQGIFVGNLIVFLFGILATLSTTPLLDKFLIFNKNFFDLFDYTSSNILMPLNGLILILFVIFVIKKENFKSFLTKCDPSKEKIINILYFILIYITPILILYIYIESLFNVNLINKLSDLIDYLSYNILSPMNVFLLILLAIFDVIKNKFKSFLIKCDPSKEKTINLLIILIPILILYIWIRNLF